MSIKDAVHSNQSGTFWQVEIPGVSAGSVFMNIVLKVLRASLKRARFQARH
jgi:hypothetical protein